MHKPNLLVLLRMQNGKVLAGFSQEGYSEKPAQPGNGWLLSVSASQVFYLKKKAQASVLRYSYHSFVFGNNDLRIEYDGSVFSIFGKDCGDFESRKYKADDLVGDGERMSEVVEFYQLSYE